MRRECRLAAAAAAIAAVVVCAPHGISAQTHTIRHFTVADGLAHNSVYGLFVDAMGYLWTATAEGLSRFDGATFITYGVGDGLGHAIVNGAVEDDRGRIWVADWGGGLRELMETSPSTTAGGRFRAQAIGASAERPVPGRVARATDGLLWFVADGDVFRGTTDDRGRLTFAPVFDSAAAPDESPIMTDAEGAAWVVVDRGLARGTASSFSVIDGAPAGIVSLSVRPDGRVVVATKTTLFEYRPGGDPRNSAAWSRIALPDTHGDLRFRSLAGDGSGAIWIGTETGLFRWSDGHLAPQPLPAAPRPWIETLLLDARGVLWAGTKEMGLFQIARPWVTGFTVADGLPELDVTRILAGSGESVVALSNTQGAVQIDGQSVQRLEKPPMGASDRIARLARDEQGGWWLSTSAGAVLHVPAAKGSSGGPSTPPDFTRGRQLFREAPDGRLPSPTLNADAAGGMWIGRLGGLFHARADAPGEMTRVALPEAFTDPVARVIRDRTGAMWAAGYSQLARVSPTGETRFWPDVLARSLFVDSRGWVWIGTRYNGAAVIKEPAASEPRFEVIGGRDGLRSGAVWSLTEDRQGRMYFGTGRGLSRLDIATGRMASLPAPVGHVQVNALLTDRTGVVWAGTPFGVFRFDPGATANPATLPVYITSVRANGVALPIPDRGVIAGSPITLARGTAQVTFEFKQVSLEAATTPAFEYQLEGTDAGWNPPTASGSVTYAGIAAGHYRFLVRAAAGAADTHVASFAFVVPTPIWQRGWFMGLVVGAFGLAGFTVQRWRGRQRRAIEQLRRQIALDLHDDVGSGLAEIAILSEVARENPDRAGDIWAEVGANARTLRDAMTDVVWSIDPREDRLDSLVRRMRRVAGNLLAASGVRLEFVSPGSPTLRRMRIAPDRRRQLLLIFKEAVHNVVKHAGASTARVALTIEAGRLRLVVADDGAGFDRTEPAAGNGLESLQQRARLLGGRLTVDSTAGRGTTIVLDAPIK